MTSSFLYGSTSAVVVGKRLVDEGIGEADAASALNLGAVKLKIGAVIRAASAIGVEVDQDGAEARHRAHRGCGDRYPRASTRHP